MQVVLLSIADFSIAIYSLNTNMNVKKHNSSESPTKLSTNIEYIMKRKMEVESKVVKKNNFATSTV